MIQNLAAQGTAVEKTLSDPGFVGTVFIPQNASLLPANLKSEAKRTVIAYHVVPGKAIQTGQLSDGQVLKTLLPNEDLTVSAFFPIRN